MSADEDYLELWNKLIGKITEHISEEDFNIWFKSIRYKESKKHKLILSAPSTFYISQIKKRFASIIEDIVKDLSEEPITIDYIVSEEKEETEKKETKSKPKKKESSTSTVTPSKSFKEAKKDIYNIPENYTFDKFVIGENSNFAANAAMAIANDPGITYNPCLIYGGVGLGKTHLLASIGNYVLEHDSSKKIAFVTAENFTNEFVESIRMKKEGQFKNKYRSADILLIDDIHFLQNKPQTQEELFHTFNALYESNKQLVFTCDRPVSELKELTDRLRSRFERGLNVDLQPPNYETRLAILKRKIENSQVDIGEDVLQFIAENVSSNVRDLEASLTKLLAYGNLLNKTITIEIARQQLKNTFSATKETHIDINTIQRVVADYFSISPNDLKGKKRTKAIANPRQIAMYIARHITEYSTTEIGLEFGGRNHTTVMHGTRKIESEIQDDSNLDTLIQRLIRDIKNYR